MTAQWHDADEQFERIRRSERATHPVGSEAARRAARKETVRSRRKQRAVGRATGGVRKRRARRWP